MIVVVFVVGMMIVTIVVLTFPTQSQLSIRIQSVHVRTIYQDVKLTGHVLPADGPTPVGFGYWQSVKERLGYHDTVEALVFLVAIVHTAAVVPIAPFG